MHYPTDRRTHTICGALAGMRNSLVGPGIEIWLRGKVSAHDGSLDRSVMVDLLSYFLFQPVLHDWYNKEHAMYHLV